MKIFRATSRLFFGLLLCYGLAGCSDLEKLFPDSSREKTKTSTRSSTPSSAKTIPNKVVITLPPICSFSPALAPKNVEVYVIDGEAWIKASSKTNMSPDDLTAIRVNIDSPAPVALLLTAKQAALWQLKLSDRTRLWGVYVTADQTQLIAGVNEPTLLQQHYAALSDKCGFYWRDELKKQALYPFTKQLFGRPYVGLPVIANGVANIGSLDVEENADADTAADPDKTTSMQTPPAITAPITETPTPRPMSLNEALRTNVIRPGSVSDIERFKSRYRDVNKRDLGRHFDERIRMMPVYVITGDFAFSGSLAGANAVVFILENKTPYPVGDSQHSPVLDMNSGNCVGRICPMMMSDE